MPAPPYMRFYVDAYCKDTLALTMEEQGVYMRLLCAMWKHGGKILDDDLFISRALPIHINKWWKVKPSIMPFLCEHSPGYLTQQKLSTEFLISSGDKSGKNAPTQGVTTGVTSGVTPHVTTGVTTHVTPQVAGQYDENATGENDEIFQRFAAIPEGGVAHALARALDLSRSRQYKNKKSRFLEDSDPDACGKRPSKEVAAEFVNRAITVFEKYKQHPPFDYAVVESWMNNGCDLLGHVLPAVETSMNRLGGSADPPKSWRYFAKEVYARKKSNKEN